MVDSKGRLVVNSITQIDCAIVDQKGNLKGASYNVTALVSGSWDKDEQVIVDFSKIKKTLKELIDDKEYGFDHKLLVETKLDYWIYEGFVCGNESYYNDNLFVRGDGHSFNLNFNEKVLSDYLSQKTGLKIEIVLDEEPLLSYFDKDELFAFRYTHGLRNSSSFGCQNILHGHKSFIRIEDKRHNALNELSKIVANVLDGVYFVNENCFNPEDNVVTYKSRERGEWYLQFNSLESKQRIIAIQTEPTIENIVSYVAKNLLIPLSSPDEEIGGIFISEGLTKGYYQPIP